MLICYQFINKLSNLFKSIFFRHNTIKVNNLFNLKKLQSHLAKRQKGRGSGGMPRKLALQVRGKNFLPFCDSN